jgi:UDP-N-acetylmuramoyl-L-alanyl-D-glutamate--2,6-diaminopimelate ligase
MNNRKLVKSLIPKSAFRKVEPYGHWAEAVIAQNKAGFPARKLKVIGVTGTDGKTTTCMLISAMLRSSGYKVACITTASVDYGDGKGEQANPTQLTTGSASQLSKLITRIKENGVEWLVLEVSSHALQQRRVWGIPFALAVMTNMSPEHLDYHGTFENYREAKQRLFKLANTNKHGLKTGIINADDKTAKHFAHDIQTAVTYGVKKGEFKASNIKSDLTGNSFTVKVGGDEYKIKSSLVGDFNVYNALATVTVGRIIGLSPKKIEQGIASLPYVTGRMMPIDEGQKFKVFVDYAVTPAALENVLSTARNLAGKGKLHIVFGATGDRDKTKRPKMGEVTSRLADKVYLTDDEVYTENPDVIRNAVYAGVKKDNRTRVTVIADRKQAIKTALSKAKLGDVVIIAGIGHQTTRNMGGKKVKWSDIETTRTLLKTQK